MELPHSHFITVVHVLVIMRRPVPVCLAEDSGGATDAFLVGCIVVPVNLHDKFQQSMEESLASSANEHFSGLTSQGTSTTVPSNFHINGQEV